MTTYPLSAEDREIQERARRFVDEELIPWEEHAEANGGRIPDDERAKHHDRAIELGFYAMNMPKELGGTGMTTLQQVLVSEQIGRVTNALGWCVHTPPAWAPAVVSDHQMQTWILPTIRGEQHECYAITEAGAGSDVDAIEATARPRRRRVRAQRREDARDLVQRRHLLLLPGEDRRRRARGRARDVLRRQADAGCSSRSRTRLHAHVPRHPRGRRVRRRARARRQPRRRGRRRHGVHLRVVPLRAADDRRPLLRRRRAPDRRGHRVRAAARAVRTARSSSIKRSRTCSPTRSPSCGPRGS